MQSSEWCVAFDGMCLLRITKPPYIRHPHYLFASWTCNTRALLSAFTRFMYFQIAFPQQWDSDWIQINKNVFHFDYIASARYCPLPAVRSDTQKMYFKSIESCEQFKQPTNDYYSFDYNSFLFHECHCHVSVFKTWPHNAPAAFRLWHFSLQ